jgi:hypothetical protein
MPKLEPIPSVSSRGGRRARATRVSSSLAEINVSPGHVMLVLLVIFMAPRRDGSGGRLPSPVARSEAPVRHVPALSSRQPRLIDGDHAAAACRAPPGGGRDR